ARLADAAVEDRGQGDGWSGLRLFEVLGQVVHVEQQLVRLLARDVQAAGVVVRRRGGQGQLDRGGGQVLPRQVQRELAAAPAAERVVVLDVRAGGQGQAV